MLCSVTRLRLRSRRFLPGFFFNAVRSQAQSKSARGVQLSLTRGTDLRTYWTLTAWDDEDAMRAFVGSGAHKSAMRKLAGWCEEASYTHWESADPPTWHDAERNLRESGRTSRVHHPSAAHAAGDPMGGDSERGATG